MQVANPCTTCTLVCQLSNLQFRKANEQRTANHIENLLFTKVRVLQLLDLNLSKITKEDWPYITNLITSASHRDTLTATLLYTQPWHTSSPGLGRKPRGTTNVVSKTLSTARENRAPCWG